MGELFFFFFFILIILYNANANHSKELSKVYIYVCYIRSSLYSGFTHCNIHGDIDVQLYCVII